MGKSKDKKKVIKLHVDEGEVFEILIAVVLLIDEKSPIKEIAKAAIINLSSELFFKSFNNTQRMYILYMTDNEGLHKIVKKKHYRFYKNFLTIKERGVAAWDAELKRIKERADNGK